jgi:hypothetical protein
METTFIITDPVYTIDGYKTNLIPVINNMIINTNPLRGGGALMQLVAIPCHDFLTGNPEITFFEWGSKYLWNNLFYYSDKSFKIKSDDYPISKITELTGEIKYNPFDSDTVYSPYYNQYSREPNNMPDTLCKQMDSPNKLNKWGYMPPIKSTCLDELIIITGDLYSHVINDAIETGRYHTVFTIRADLAYERRRHAVIAMNIYLYI